MTPISSAVAHDTSSDETLVARAQRGGRRAFEVLVARYKDRIYRMAMRMSHNASDAEEITQETFLRAHRGIGSFRGDSHFGTWLYRIAMNEALMRRRAAKRRPLVLLEGSMRGLAEAGLVDWAPQCADELVHSKSQLQRVHDALEQLDPDQRAALVLRDLEEMTAEGAAQVLGVSPEVVRQRAHRARLKLREVLSDLLVEPR